MVTLNSYPQVQLQVSPVVFFLLHFDIERKGNILLHTSAQEVNCNFSHQLNFTLNVFSSLLLVQTVPTVLPSLTDRSSTAVCSQGLFQNNSELARKVHTVAAASFPCRTFLADSGVWYMHALAYRRPWLLLSHMILAANYYSTSRALSSTWRPSLRSPLLKPPHPQCPRVSAPLGRSSSLQGKSI